MNASMSSVKESEKLRDFTPFDHRHCPDHLRAPVRSLGSGWVRCPNPGCMFTRYNPKGAKE